MLRAKLGSPKPVKASLGSPEPVKASVGLREGIPSGWGVWGAAEEYTPLIKVSHEGSSYVCIKACVGVDPALDVGEGVEGECWLLIAKRGAAFTYDMFTEQQLAALKGRPFTYEDFTPAQLEALRGPAGETITDISRTSGTGAPGTVDTYTVTTSTGRTWPLYLYNGKDGKGAGDMTAEVYDPQGKAQDIFNYVDEKLKDVDFDVTADEVTFSDGQTFQQKYDSGDLTGPQGPAGANGQPGEQGPAGYDGHTPVKGTDYWTDTDKQEIIEDLKDEGIGGATVLTAIIGTSWTDNDDGTKSQTVSMAGVTADNNAQVDTYYNDGEYADYVEAQNQFLEFITNGFAKTVAGGITFTIFGEANTVSIPIIVEVV